MKYVFTFTLMILLSSISHAESLPSAPQPVPKPTSPRKVDEYGKISFKEEKKRIKPAAKEIKDDQNQFGDMSMVMIFYGEKCTTLKRINNIKNYLVKVERIESNRISTIYGGTGDSKTEIFLIPTKPPAANSNTDLNKEQDCRITRKNPQKTLKKQSHQRNQRTWRRKSDFPKNVAC